MGGGGGGGGASPADLKSQGNAAFAAKKYEAALKLYEAAVGSQSDPEERAKLHSNRAACCMALGRYKAAEREASDCIALLPSWAKGHYRRAEALKESGRRCEALVSAMDALTLDSSNSEVKALVLALSARIELGGEQAEAGGGESGGSPPGAGSEGEKEEKEDSMIVSENSSEESNKWRCAWGPLDPPDKWKTLDAVEQSARAPPRTVGHCLELLVSAGIAADEIKEWAEAGVLRIHIIGADSAFELTSRLEDIVHVVKWAVKVEVVLIGFNWSWADIQGTRAKVRDADAPSPPRVLKTLSKRKFLDRRHMYVRGFQGYYHEFIDAGHSPPHFALAMHPDLVTEYGSWAPTISRLISLNIPTFLTGAEGNGSLWHNVVIVQELGGRVVVPPRAHRFPITACQPKGSARNHNIMAFHGCNIAVQSDLMHAPSTVANFANTRRNLINLGIDIPDHTIDSSSYPSRSLPVLGGARAGLNGLPRGSSLGGAGPAGAGGTADAKVPYVPIADPTGCHYHDFESSGGGSTGSALRGGPGSGAGSGVPAISARDLDAEYAAYDADLHELAASFLRGVGVDDMKSLVEAAARLGIPGPEL